MYIYIISDIFIATFHMTQISLSYKSPTILRVKTRRRMAYAKSLPYTLSDFYIEA